MNGVEAHVVLDKKNKLRDFQEIKWHNWNIELSSDWCGHLHCNRCGTISHSGPIDGKISLHIYTLYQTKQ